MPTAALLLHVLTLAKRELVFILFISGSMIPDMPGFGRTPWKALDPTLPSLRIQLWKSLQRSFHWRLFWSTNHDNLVNAVPTIFNRGLPETE